MNKKTFSRLSAAILLLLTISTPVGAQEISVEAARQTAAKFINEHAAKLPAKSRKGMMKAPPKAESLQLVYTQEDQLHESPALYVFEQPKQGGFVIASADERAYPILGYNESGTFREDSLPCCLKFILEEYGRQIAEARKQNLPRHTEKADNESWQNIEPLLTCTWGQGAPFNNLYPIWETGRRVLTGCTTTSFIQIMYYWKWPKRGVGSKSMNWMKDIPVTVNFGETTYRWDLMKDSYASQDDDPENAVATLFYHFSVATTGNWSYDSAPSDIFGGLSTHFNYSKLNEIGGMSPDIIYKELSRGIPLQISGGDIEDPYGEGHAYVCDGYRTDGFFHFNLGWGGSSNGYYKMDAVSGFKSRDACKIVPKIDEITEANGLVYDILYTGGACLSEAKNAEGHIEIPGEITINGKKHPVTDIYGGVFRDNSAITSVTIPNSVISIGWEAFRGCSGLTSVTIGNSVESIGSYAFFGCSNLTSITIPNSVESIGCYAFNNTGIYNNSADGVFYVDKWACGYKGTMPANLVLQEGTVGIASHAFSGRSGLTSVTIPNSVTSIGEDAFSYWSGLTSVTIGNSVTSIGSNAFRGCSGLTSVTIGNSVESIGSYAFYKCSGLTSVTFHCKEIGSWFKGNTNIKEIVISDEVTSIGNSAFDGCSGLTSVTIPNSVTSIGEYAFADCSGLTSVTIPNSVTSIGEFAFAVCSGLTSIVVESGNSKYDSRENCNAIIETASNTLIAGCMNSIIPNSVSSIGDGAFVGCSGLTSVTIPNSVTNIGNYAFVGCSGLTSISVASGNNKYDSRGNCNAIIETASNTLIQGCKNTIIPNSVTSIGEDAFSYCSGLTSITIPNSVTTIGNWAFASCPGLTSVISCIENPFAIDTSVFEDIPSDATLYVPIGTSDKYKSTFCWNYFKNIVEIEIDGIEGVIVEDSSDCENAPMYNLSGQRVGKNYKGIVIKNGKKVKK